MKRVAVFLCLFLVCITSSLMDVPPVQGLDAAANNQGICDSEFAID